MSDPLHLEEDVPARRLAYVGAILLVLIPFLQATQQLWPLQLGNIRWRYGAANALSSVLLLPFLGMSLAALVARSANSHRVARGIGVAAAVGAVALIGSVILFVLDALQLKAIITSPMLASFEATTARVLAVTAIFAVAFLALAMTALNGPRSSEAVRRGKRRGENGPGLIVGQEFARQE